MGISERKALIAELERLRDSRVICCVTSNRVNAPGMIAKDFIPIFYNHLRNLGELKRLDIFIFTSGGDTLAGFGISRLLREFSANYVGALIPESCHSAGTLIVLGANEIFMTPAATLSPIDPSVVTAMNPKPDGQGQPFPVSVENIAGFKDLAREDWKLSAEGNAAAFRILAERVHPLILGQAYRTRQQIERLARVLLTGHRSDTKNIQRIVAQLTRQLGSHDYLISRTEAREIFGRQAIGDDSERRTENAVWALFEDFRDDMELGRVYDPGAYFQQIVSAKGPIPAKIKAKLVTIESSFGSDVWETEVQLQMAQAPAGGPTPGMQQLQQTVLHNGWRHYT